MSKISLVEAAQQALEALEKNTKHLPVHFDYHFEAIAALRAALEEPPFEVNFCARCGKRTRDVHSCTPPPKL